MKKPDIQRSVEFMRLVHAFEGVERVIWAPDLTRKENDVEHSYSLAMLCWYVNDALDLKLDTRKILEYSLVHDLVEVYAGDVYIFDKEGAKAKHEREEEARLRIAKEFPEFAALHEAILTYEQRADDEARFVYAMDKLIPMIINYLEKGHGWKEMKVDREELWKLKLEKTKDQEVVHELMQQLIDLIEPRWEEFFSIGHLSS